jgi:hypothetical protein
MLRLPQFISCIEVIRQQSGVYLICIFAVRCAKLRHMSAEIRQPRIHSGGLAEQAAHVSSRGPELREDPLSERANLRANRILGPHEQEVALASEQLGIEEFDE